MPFSNYTCGKKVCQMEDTLAQHEEQWPSGVSVSFFSSPQNLFKFVGFPVSIQILIQPFLTPFCHQLNGYLAFN